MDGITFWTSTHGSVMGSTPSGTVFDSARGIVGTRRWHAWRDGLEDYQYCKLLHDLAMRTKPDKRDPALDLLNQAVASVLALEKSASEATPPILSDLGSLLRRLRPTRMPEPGWRRPLCGYSNTSRQGNSQRLPIPWGKDGSMVNLDSVEGLAFGGKEQEGECDADSTVVVGRIDSSGGRMG